jgi:hypothetical protein
MHNDLTVTKTIEPQVSHFERFVEALHAAITWEVGSLPRHIGAVWQFADSTDILSHARRCQDLATHVDDYPVQ